jgi:putative FmdB family regulatory protein
MPIYEYKCDKCGVFEVTQRITEDPLRRCPTCKSKVERLLSASSFILKGSGWYITDYGRKGSGISSSSGTNGSSSESSTTESASASAKSSDKPAD